MTPPVVVEAAGRRVIEGKLLEALEGDDCVAVLMSREDLDLVISLLEQHKSPPDDEPWIPVRVTLGRKGEKLVEGLRVLRREGFP